MIFFFDGKQALLYILKENEKTVIIDHNRESGEFRYEVQLSKDSIEYMKNNFSNLDLNKLVVVDYFYSMKEAVRYCEVNHLKFEE